MMIFSPPVCIPKPLSFPLESPFKSLARSLATGRSRQWMFDDACWITATHGYLFLSPSLPLLTFCTAGILPHAALILDGYEGFIELWSDI